MAPSPNPGVLAGSVTLLCAAWSSGCLPGDTRPEAGVAHTTVTGSLATQQGTTTADGWTLEFDRALLAIGPIQLDDEPPCYKYAEYSEPGYGRVIDVTQPGAQKLSDVYGRGPCPVDLQISPPDADAVLGVEVTQADKDFMRTPGSDRYVKNDGISFHLEGSATQATRVVRFRWDIRQKLYFTKCRATIDGKVQEGFNYVPGQTTNVDLLIEAEALFRDDRDRTTAALRFDPFAEADLRGDSNGEVTLEELAAISLFELRAGTGNLDADGGKCAVAIDAGDGGSAADVNGTLPNRYSVGCSNATTLEDYVYRVLFGDPGPTGDGGPAFVPNPTILIYRDNGACEVGGEEA
jgi:hypothetical protein